MQTKKTTESDFRLPSHMPYPACPVCEERANECECDFMQMARDIAEEKAQRIASRVTERLLKGPQKGLSGAVTGVNKQSTEQQQIERAQQLQSMMDKMPPLPSAKLSDILGPAGNYRYRPPGMRKSP